MSNNDTPDPIRMNAYRIRVDPLLQAAQELIQVADSLDRGDCLKAKSAARRLRLDANKAWHDISAQK
jgi:hypothetical protein